MIESEVPVIFEHFFFFFGEGGEQFKPHWKHTQLCGTICTAPISISHPLPLKVSHTAESSKCQLRSHCSQIHKSKGGTSLLGHTQGENNCNQGGVEAPPPPESSWSLSLLWACSKPAVWVLPCVPQGRSHWGKTDAVSSIILTKGRQLAAYNEIHTNGHSFLSEKHAPSSIHCNVDIALSNVHILISTQNWRLTSYLTHHYPPSPTSIAIR